MRKRSKMNKKKSKRLFKKTAYPTKINKQKTGIVKRGGTRL